MDCPQKRPLWACYLQRNFDLNWWLTSTCWKLRCLTFSMRAGYPKWFPVILSLCFLVLAFTFLKLSLYTMERSVENVSYFYMHREKCFISKQMLLHTQNAHVWFCSNINYWHLTVHLLALFYLWYFSLIKYTSDLSVSHCLQLWISRYTFHVTMLIVTDLFWLSMSFNLF